MRLTPILLVLATSSLAAPILPAQTVTVPTIPADPRDVSTIDGIMKAFYDVISGPAGEPRQWSRDRTLYIPDMRFVSMDVDSSGKPVASVMSHQQFVDRSNPGLVKNGFYEQEIHRVTRRFGNIAHVFSTYAMRQTPTGPIFGRGVNSVQLFWDGTRWWIANATWDDERKDNPIPKEFLP
ncbi:MAG TPA: hypothetical protein VG817_06615 [Gemmatimonadales bacterium]|nr:hypothetical protein [Gemmatimonadales bacterium]